MAAGPGLPRAPPSAWMTKWSMVVSAFFFNAMHYLLEYLEGRLGIRKGVMPGTSFQTIISYNFPHAEPIHARTVQFREDHPLDVQNLPVVGGLEADLVQGLLELVEVADDVVSDKHGAVHECVELLERILERNRILPFPCGVADQLQCFGVRVLQATRTDSHREFPDRLECGLAPPYGAELKELVFRGAPPELQIDEPQ